MKIRGDIKNLHVQNFPIRLRNSLRILRKNNVIKKLANTFLVYFFKVHYFFTHFALVQLVSIFISIVFLSFIMASINVI
jgi:hypothetical protein